MAQSLRETLDCGVGHLWMLLDEAMQLFLAEDVDHARLHRGGAGGIGAAIERWHVVEGLAGAEQAQDLFAASGGGSVHFDESGLHVVEAVAARAFEQDDAPARDP